MTLGSLANDNRAPPPMVLSFSHGGRHGLLFSPGSPAALLAHLEIYRFVDWNGYYRVDESI